MHQEDRTGGDVRDAALDRWWGPWFEKTIRCLEHPGIRGFLPPVFSDGSLAKSGFGFAAAIVTEGSPREEDLARQRMTCCEMRDSLAMGLAVN
jgi:hypothetical protein